MGKAHASTLKADAKETETEGAEWRETEWASEPRCCSAVKKVSARILHHLYFLISSCTAVRAHYTLSGRLISSGHGGDGAGGAGGRETVQGRGRAGAGQGQGQEQGQGERGRGRGRAGAGQGQGRGQGRAGQGRGSGRAVAGQDRPGHFFSFSLFLFFSFSLLLFLFFSFFSVIIS